MFINLLNWSWILFTTYILGYTVINTNLRRHKCVDVIISAGFVIATVYAEVFSIFYKVGLLASLMLLGIVIMLFILQRKSIVLSLEKAIDALKQVKNWKKVICIVLIIFFLFNSARYPISWDDFLYHAQALRWIEEYGLVKGLGNLHERFAFNSAFLCLQALFGWSFAPFVHDSLHTINSLGSLLFTLYCILTMSPINNWNNIKSSDILKGLGLLYIAENINSIIGIETDILCILFVQYIFIKWVELDENDERPRELYAFLAIIALYTCTLKLSAVMLCLLTIYPLIKFVKDKDIIGIFGAFLACIIIVAPFIARNILLSGYLVFPYEQLDILNVKWKVPINIVEDTINGIVIWGKSTQAAMKIDAAGVVRDYPLQKWFPYWFSGINLFYKLCFVAAVSAIIIHIFYVLYKVTKKKQIPDHEFVTLVAIAGFIFWFLQAPALRFGSVFMWITIALVSTDVLSAVRCANAVLLFMCCGVVAIFGIHRLRQVDFKDVNIVASKGYYYDVEYDEYSIDGQHVIYVPVEGDRADYQHFPETPSKKIASNIKLLGKGFSGGFYMGSDKNPE